MLSLECLPVQGVHCFGAFISQWAVKPLVPSVVQEKQLGLSMVIHWGWWFGNGFTA